MCQLGFSSSSSSLLLWFVVLSLMFVMRSINFGLVQSDAQFVKLIHWRMPITMPNFHCISNCLLTFINSHIINSLHLAICLYFLILFTTTFKLCKFVCFFLFHSFWSIVFFLFKKWKKNIWETFINTTACVSVQNKKKT